MPSSWNPHQILKWGNPLGLWPHIIQCHLLWMNWWSLYLYMIYLKNLLGQISIYPKPMTPKNKQTSAQSCPVSPCIPPRGSGKKLRKGAQPFRKWAKRSWTHSPQVWDEISVQHSMATPPQKKRKLSPKTRRLSWVVFAFLRGGGG